MLLNIRINFLVDINDISVNEKKLFVNGKSLEDSQQLPRNSIYNELKDRLLIHFIQYYHFVFIKNTLLFSYFIIYQNNYELSMN